MTEPASIRYKNPGAMWPGKIPTKWGSTRFVALNDGTGQGNKIAVFDTWVQGICAQLDLWRTSPNYKNKRFADAIAIWSGHNNVPSYIVYCKKRVPGLTEDTIMNDAFWFGPMGIPFLKAQSGHEAGKPIPAPDADWIEAQRRVFAAKTPASPTKKKAAAVVATSTVATTAAVQAHSAGWSLTTIFVILGIGAVAAVAAWYFIHKRAV
ncbi:hypothetical protein AB7714_28370 [Tardiphaga sp. 1201_B9_N1_1]|uniref:hypothetical protein n=1 Tax=unclassified Tardiphaga TaxID=2631404 RepID=UPI003F28A865